MLLTFGTSSFIISLYRVPSAASRLEYPSSTRNFTLDFLLLDRRVRSCLLVLGDFYIGAEQTANCPAHYSELMLCANSLQNPSLCLDYGLEARDHLSWVFNFEFWILAKPVEENGRSLDCQLIALCGCNTTEPSCDAALWEATTPAELSLPSTRVDAAVDPRLFL